ncbi:hypothetical protein QN277_016589 [Acacia crassicarpa]|uniref:ADP-ribosyl cyclase/cyclic ADP-ribose hydrolase n=1 Tax=Acacia crassicarpa TaxID=499986 RepID=A0AAE1MWX5_9FABA|nr:hypothetical protein QN277_016589 [Acacia crassicarpa]
MSYAAQEESSPSFSTSKREYDVFLSFAGKDTRLNFTDHLYEAFVRRGIKSFRDDKGIKRGDVIEEKLLQAIKESLSAIVVLSHNYAYSTWCLDELEEIPDLEKYSADMFFLFSAAVLIHLMLDIKERVSEKL